MSPTTNKRQQKAQHNTINHQHHSSRPNKTQSKKQATSIQLHPWPIHSHDYRPVIGSVSYLKQRSRKRNDNSGKGACRQPLGTTVGVGSLSGSSRNGPTVTVLLGRDVCADNAGRVIGVNDDGAVANELAAGGDEGKEVVRVILLEFGCVGSNLATVLAGEITNFAGLRASRVAGDELTANIGIQVSLCSSAVSVSGHGLVVDVVRERALSGREALQLDGNMDALSSWSSMEQELAVDLAGLIKGSSVGDIVGIASNDCSVAEVARLCLGSVLGKGEGEEGEDGEELHVDGGGWSGMLRRSR